MPLLIGGATTSRVHTAVKIAPHYANGPTVYVPDASRAVGVVTSLLSDDQRDGYVAQVAARLRNDPRAARRQARAEARVARSRPRERVRARLAALRAAGAVVHRPARVSQRRPRGDRAVHRLGVRSSRRGSSPGPSRRSSTIRSWARRRARVHAEGQAMLAADRRRALARCEWRRRDSGPLSAVGDDIVLWTDEDARDAASHVAQPAPAERAARGQAELLPRRFRRARESRVRAITSARSR